MEDYKIKSFEFVVKLIGFVMRLWAFSGFTFASCFFLYYLYGGLFAFLLLIFAITGILYNAEDKLLYHPELPPHSRVFVPIPTMYGLPYENLYVPSADGTVLHMFFVKQPAERMRTCMTLVFFHGNAGNMGHRLQNVAGFYTNLGCNVLMVEYRGYGLSEGYPNEEGLYMDARTAIDYLMSRTDICREEIVVFGRSLGGAVAIDVATRPGYCDKIAYVVVENTFTSIPEMAKVLLSWRMIKYLPLIFYKNKYLSLYKVSKLQQSILFVSGLADMLVPPWMMSELHSRCGSERKQLMQMRNGTHNETWNLQDYYHNIKVFLQNSKTRRISLQQDHKKTVTKQKIHIV